MPTKAALSYYVEICIDTTDTDEILQMSEEQKL